MYEFDLWFAFAVGAFFGYVVHWFIVTLEKYQRDGGAASRPQMVVLPTAKTPDQVTAEAAEARRRAFMLRLTAVIVILIGLSIVFPGVGTWLIDLLNRLLVAVQLEFLTP